MSSPWENLGDFTFSVDSDSVFELRHEGKALDESMRKELLQRLHNGEHIEIEFDAETYVQRDTPNSKFVRFKPSILKKVAASAVGSPFLRDHDTNSLLAKGGKIVASWHEKNSKGEDVFVQTVRLKKRWAVECALDGTLEKFSVGIRATGPIRYRHNNAVLEKPFPRLYPGQELEDGTKVEWVFTSALLAETSGVLFPAVDGTQITGIREALSLALGGSPGKEQSALNNRGIPPHGETQMNGLRKILGLSESAGEQEFTAAVGKLQAELDVEREKAATASLELSKLQVSYEKLSAGQMEQFISAALADGRLQVIHDNEGKREHSKLETILREQGAKFGADVMNESLSSLPKLFAPPMASQSKGTEPTQDPPQVVSDDVSEALSNNPHVSKMAGQLGLSEEDLRIYGGNKIH